MRFLRQRDRGLPCPPGTRPAFSGDPAERTGSPSCQPGPCNPSTRQLSFQQFCLSTRVAVFSPPARISYWRLLHFAVGTVQAPFLFTFLHLALEADFGGFHPLVCFQRRLVCSDRRLEFRDSLL